MPEICVICGCKLNRVKGVYATSTIEGRSHATQHHYVAERFFGRSATRRGEQREPIFKKCPWGVEGQIKRIELFVSLEVGDYLQNEKRAAIANIEQLSDKRVIIHSAPDYVGEKHNLLCYNERGSVVKL